jgi:hypothetical protein
MGSCRDGVPRMNYVCTNDKMMAKDWLKEFTPKTPSDLVLQKPKLDELNLWLQKASKCVGEVRWCGRLILRVSV